jgi:hypothetical protein
MSDYNGWSNRETWAVNLHLSNDQDLYEHTNYLARRATCAEHLAEYLQAFVGETPKDCPIPLLVSDLEGDDWNDINWLEVAENWL